MKPQLLLFLLLAFSTAVLSQDKAAKLDSLFSGMAREGKFNGNVLIAEKGVPIYQKSFGVADRSINAPLNENSIFELASVSKQFTSMGIMLLKKQGKLSYSDTLRKFFPELPYQNITIQQLLQHTSGLPDYMDLVMNNTDSTKIATNKEMIALLASSKLPPVFSPGEKWEYSNTGYALLASIIEKVSGKTYPDFLAQQIFKPLGMTNTLVYRRRYEKRRLKNYAYGYEFIKSEGKIILPDSSKEVQEKMVYVLDGIVGDGTVNSTTVDLLKWDRSLYTEKLISKAMLEEAFTPAVTRDTAKTNYGYGWGISNIAGMGKIVSHTGGWPGYVTRIERHLDNDKTIIVLSNFGAPAPFINSVRNILYGIVEPVASLDSSKLKEFVGDYELVPGFIITISVAGNKIFAQATGQESAEIFNEKDDLFYLKVVEAKLQFGRDENKKVNKLTLFQNGQELEGKKLINKYKVCV